MRRAAVFDTNIVMDYARGFIPANEALRSCHSRVICSLTYMEMMISIPEDRIRKMKEFLRMNFEIEPLDQSAMEHACYLKTHYRLSMPDAIIYGYARSRSLPLMTRNTKDFNPRWTGILVPYELRSRDTASRLTDPAN
jgi:predicted nucleic acid-binding protein